MGTTTMLTANGPLYRHVQGLDFRVLMYLAQITLDSDRDGTPARTYFGGIQAIVTDLYDLSPNDPGYDNAYRRVQRSIANLVDSGAIRRTVLATKRDRAHYEICPLQGMLSDDLKATVTKPSGTTSRAVPPSDDGESSEEGGTTSRAVSGTTSGAVHGTTFGAVHGTTSGAVPNERTQSRTQLRTQPEEQPSLPRTRDLAHTSTHAREATR